MFQRRGRKKWTAWVAMAAVLVGAIFPTLLHAMRAGPTDGGAEICSVEGEKWVKLDPSVSAPLPIPAQHHVLEHCPYCSLQHAGLGMPPATLPIAASPATHVEVAVERPAPRVVAPWLRKQPRGPPHSDDLA